LIVGVGRLNGGAAVALLAALTAACSAAGAAAPATSQKPSTSTEKPAAPAVKPSPTAAAPFLAVTEWRYRDGLEPQATAPGFDDSKWETIKDPATGRGKGGVSYGWYRTTLQVPERIGNVPVAGKPLQLAVLADKYAEVWVNGDFRFQFDPKQAPSAPKNRPMGYEIAGFNKANVVPLGVRKAGDAIPVAVLTINGPLGKPIGNYSIRYARLEFAPAK
jgi:hypothetical protein